MSVYAWIQFAVVIIFLLCACPVMGRYLAAVYGGKKSPGDRFFDPIEKLLYRICGVDPKREQRWNVYALALLAFSLVSTLALYLLQRIQGRLPMNPTGVHAVSPTVAWNTAVSFVTNTNWQSYAGESTMSHLTQMMGLAVQNFVSAAVGICVAIALVRGFSRFRATTIGNFWVDLTRTIVRVLLPLSFVVAILLVASGTIQNFSGFTKVRTVEGTTQQIPGGPVASQESIKELGTNGGGFYNANSAHPFENPTPVTNVIQICILLFLPFSLAFAFGHLVGDYRQGLVIFTAMFVLWFGAAVIAMVAETDGNSLLMARGVSQTATSSQPGGNFEGKETRFGSAGCGLYASSTTGTSTGAVNCAHDSLTPIGGAVTLTNLMFGEVSPGGTGSGLYGMLIFVLTAVFIAGLMVGRTPEYLGKQIQSQEVKLVVVYLLIVPLVALCFGGAAVLMRTALAGRLNDGPHGLSEMMYAYLSSANNNGSAFGGLTVTSNWYQTTLGVVMLAGRFLLMIPALAISGSLARKPRVAASAGTFPTGTPLFAGLLIGVAVIIVGLTYFPVLALGPIIERLAM